MLLLTWRPNFLSNLFFSPSWIFSSCSSKKVSPWNKNTHLKKMVLYRTQVTILKLSMYPYSTPCTTCLQYLYFKFWVAIYWWLQPRYSKNLKLSQHWRPFECSRLWRYLWFEKLFILHSSELGMSPQYCR